MKYRLPLKDHNELVTSIIIGKVFAFVMMIVLATFALLCIETPGHLLALASNPTLKRVGTHIKSFGTGMRHGAVKGMKVG